MIYMRMMGSDTLFMKVGMKMDFHLQIYWYLPQDGSSLAVLLHAHSQPDIVIY